MNYNNTLTPGQIFLKLALCAGLAYAGHHIYQKHFKGKSPDEVKVMIDDAFTKIYAIINIIHEGTGIAQEVFQSLQSGYISLSTSNVTPEKVQRVESILHNLNILLEDKPEAKEPIEIICESIHIIAKNNGFKQLA